MLLSDASGPFPMSITATPFPLLAELGQYHMHMEKVCGIVMAGNARYCVCGSVLSSVPG